MADEKKTSAKNTKYIKKKKKKEKEKKHLLRLRKREFSEYNVFFIRSAANWTLQITVTELVRCQNTGIELVHCKKNSNSTGTQ